MTIINDTNDTSGAEQSQNDVQDTTASAVVADKQGDGKVDPVDASNSSAKDDNKAQPAEDWRLKYAGGDEKELKKLGRFVSEQDIYKAYKELEKLKSLGHLKKPLPENPTKEEIAQWRNENNIPESVDKYDLTFENGLVIGEQDKPFIDEFVANMHGKNATNEQVKAAIQTYYDILGKQQEALAEQDSDYQTNSIMALKEEWAGDYKKNVTAVNNLLGEAPESVRDLVATARGADGSIIGNNPEVIKWLAKLAYEINPVASVMPSSMSNPAAGIEEEIAKIEDTIKKDPNAYWKGEKGEKMQARYRELLEAKLKMK